MLFLDVAVGQSVAIGGPATVRVERKSGQSIRLAFDADRSVPIQIVDAPAPRAASTGLTGKPDNPEAGLGTTKGLPAAD